MIKAALKKLLPASFLDLYHRLLSWLAAVRYGRPSERMLVIGVTGTNGKSTVANIVARLFESSGRRVGLTTTANFKVADREWLNDTKMTMLGRFRLQSLLRQMVDAGCSLAVVETSSEGIRQHRHSAINYDAAVFTNLTPEHIESHGGFDNYRRAKGRLFAKLSRERRKFRDGRSVPKVIVANLGDEHADYFLGFAADRKIGFFVPKVEGERPREREGVETVAVDGLSVGAAKSTFFIRDVRFELSMPGRFNVENALAAVCVGLAYGLDLSAMSDALRRLPPVPGRIERIDEGQPFGAIVDYAPEPESFRKLYEVVDLIPKRRVIHVLGSCGGGRDIGRRPVLGRLAADSAQVVIVTNEDPYDDDPSAIIRDVAAGARERGKRDGVDLFEILDRGEAIRKAVDLAEDGDLVLVTGKGCEQAMVVAGGRKIPWDDRTELRRAIRARLDRPAADRRTS
ncbi:MAG: UDP-N-acetylmuramyl-tripeptide synthetase [bacterium]